MAAIAFGATPPIPRKCLTCKRPAWEWDRVNATWVCLTCTPRNPLEIKYGPGPAEARCGGCAHLLRLRYHGALYRKCDLRKITHGPKSDHKATWPACARFEPGEEGKQ